jgi:cell division protein FtsZ
MDGDQARPRDVGHGAPTNFIPPVAERPEEMQPRMPRVEDFPAVAQRQMRAQQVQPVEVDEEEKRPRGLLARLTHGLTRRDEDDEPVRQTQSPRAMEIEPRLVQHAQPAQPQHAAAPNPSEFAKATQPRRTGEPHAAGSLDQRGRQPAQTADAARDDQLEIPAFLRRQTN